MAGEPVNKQTELEGQIGDLESQVANLEKLLSEASKNHPDLEKALAIQEETLTKVDELTTALEKALQDNEVLKATLALEKAMSADEKDYCKDMTPEEKDKFMGKSPEDRKAAMSKRAEELAKNEETVQVSGRTIKKSVVGEDVFVIMKAQADEIAKNEKRLQVEIEKRETAELQKRADDEFAHVPGSTEERAKMLGALNKMDEPLRKSFEAVFVQSEKLAKAGFDKIGTKGRTPEGDSIAKKAADFESKVEEIAARDSLNRTKALTKARTVYPELFKAYMEHEAS